MSINILVVDDSTVMRRMIIRTLEMAELPIGTIHEAANGREGLAALTAHWIDVVLLDLNMPVMDGFEFARCLRENEATRDLKILVVSTEGSESRLEEIRPLVSGIVHKPFTPEEVGEKIRAITGVEDE